MICVHKLDQLYCAYCRSGKRLDMTNKEVDDLDGFEFPPKPERSWGGSGTVTTIAKDGKPVRIPMTHQYLHIATSRHDTMYPNEGTGQLMEIAYNYVPKTAMKKGLRLPDDWDRQDIAQDAVLAFLEWCNSDPLDEETEEDGLLIRRLCFFVGAAYFKWLATVTITNQYLDIDADGFRNGLVERWAEPGTYLPLMKILEDARAATDPTPHQQRLITAWAIFDPEFEGRLARNTREEPLTDAERQFLKRLRDGFVDDVPTDRQVKRTELALSTTENMLARFGVPA